MNDRVLSDGWRKSSFSGAAGECVEFARGTGGEILIRDSKDPSGPALAFTPGEWRAFVRGVRHDEFDV
ncbi:DUF397 domain-containing protein [Nonomuraea longispora]|uniref:DUF397 domain-containing protein n=1 Tax=Nonomuraea longispora TaxID=1848320 RepID=A0A4R4NN21_9ACTN|nr:DUF397 domain-containing protein [Nonomuraea longispora]TDC10881.1 DUF397 domain-containing protein [Nonomuraea longispora]